MQSGLPTAAGCTPEQRAELGVLTLLRNASRDPAKAESNRNWQARQLTDGPHSPRKPRWG